MATLAELDRRVTNLESQYATIITKIDRIETAPRRVVIWLAGVVIAAAISQLVGGYWFHQQNVATSTAAAQQAETSVKQGQAIAQAVGAPIVPSPKTP